MRIQLTEWNPYEKKRRYVPVCRALALAAVRATTFATEQPKSIIHKMGNGNKLFEIGTFAHITRKKTALSFDYKIGDNPLLNVRSFKYLGVIIHHDLCWRLQVEEVCSRAYRKLRFLRKKKVAACTKKLKVNCLQNICSPGFGVRLLRLEPSSTVLAR